ncbi:poly-gamma-glutamate biosynthesis protein [Spongiactinospora gelatinilytica]|uniref:Poly-gamma-glutamate biosynthesis protein n=1 Tax=Spongiactinospora gelatinilytica TaxID=2666298 RepID=A0A2W2I8V7_9ACTN|nr:CapA family protein [Spongiactinospora gelatinilytica]PZG46874.1 poly-gamma-glutamate biosynthesis protein [Spongiactinospora gelatinilytica]
MKRFPLPPVLRRARALVAVTAAAALLTAACSAGEKEPEKRAAENSAEPSPPAKTTKPKPERRPYTISFGGDVHFEGVLRARLDANPRTALGPIASVLKKADLTMVNLETAITTAGTPAPGKQYTFRAPPTAFTALKAAGVDVASMANNHGMDYMRSGLRDSLAAIRKSRFPIVGVGKDDAQAYKPYRTTVNGNRVAIIGATQVLDAEFIQSWTATSEQGGLASAKNEERLIQAVRAARKNSDTVIVHLHWGTELQKCPNPAQRSLAPRLVAAGADVIVGGHAHILLGGGYLKGSYVNYGMGNFVFYNSGPETGKTGVLTLTIQGRKVLKDQWTPARINGGVPVPLTGAARKQAVTEWRGLRSCTGLSADRGDR